jgi:hypothetical protein
MTKIDRRTAVALGLGGFVTANAPAGEAHAQGQQPSPPRPAERLFENRIVLAFVAEPDAVRRWLPEGWEPFATPAGPFRGCNLFLPFQERVGRHVADGPAAAPEVWRYATLVTLTRARDDGRTGFAYIRMWLPAAAVRGFGFGGARAAEVEREVTQRGVGNEPAAVREAWTMRANEGGDRLRVALDYRQSPTPQRAPFDQRLVSAPEIRPPVEVVNRVDRLLDVLRSQGNDDPRLTRFEFEAAVPELREALGGAEPRPQGIAAEPVILRDVGAGS